MKVRLAAYSLTGLSTAERIASVLSGKGMECSVWAPEKYCEGDVLPIKGSAMDWAKDGFENADALIFCCASGIAVRAIASHVKSKTTDPAVIVTDELGHFVIPLLSGHIGGANELSSVIADELGSTAVVTTATDIHGLFAVDVFATKNHLKIKSMKLAKEVSVDLLAGKKIGFESDIEVRGELPEGLVKGEAELGICISKEAKAPFERTLRLVPQSYAVGMGCRKGKDPGELEEFFLKMLSEKGISPDELRCIASIDIKKDEEGLKALSKKYRVPFVCFTAEELMKAEGAYSSSSFVADTTGVDCVCERAAVCAGAKELIVKKQAENGMTFALGKYEEVIHFE
ncbi:MAG: cobalt-precorrin 5A hydrolase [Firmicutes bacterium]|nr:cobalt-precorrin 5A hydrolase [Bacillota bacterium]